MAELAAEGLVHMGTGDRYTGAMIRAATEVRRRIGVAIDCHNEAAGWARTKALRAAADREGLGDV